MENHIKMDDLEVFQVNNGCFQKEWVFPPNHPMFLIGFSIIFTKSIHSGVLLFLETPRFCFKTVMVLFCFNKNKHLPETSNKKTYTTRTWDGKPKQQWRMKAFHNLCWFFRKIKRKLQAKASTRSKRSNSNALQLCHAIATLLPQDLQCRIQC